MTGAAGWLYGKACSYVCCFRNKGFIYGFNATIKKILKTLLIAFKSRLLNRLFYFNSLYFIYFDVCNSNKNPKFVPLTGVGGYYQRKEKDSKIVAWYFVQNYQKMKERSRRGGFWKWFKEAALPMFVGCHKLYEPYEMKDDDVELVKRQVEIAKMYGVYGFGFQYSDQEFLSLFLKHKEIEMSFCVRCDIKDFDRDSFEKNIFSCFRDKRYINVHGKPFFCINLREEFDGEKIYQLLHSFRNKALAFGFSGVHIVLSGDFSTRDVADFGADAYMEFWPAGLQKNCSQIVPKYCPSKYKGKIFDIESAIEKKAHLQNHKSKVYYRSAMVSFDDSSNISLGQDCEIYQNLTPDIYKIWLTDILKENYLVKDNEHNYVFVNNWNAWENGSSLEPDILYGYSYLDKTQEALEELWDLDTLVIDRALDERRRKGITDIRFCVHFVLSMGDNVACEPIARYLKRLEPSAKVVWIMLKRFVDFVKYNPNIDEIIEVCSSEESKKLLANMKTERRNIIIDCHFDKSKIPPTIETIFYNKNNPMIKTRNYYNYGSLLVCFSYAAGLPGIKDVPIFHQRPGLKLPNTLSCKYVIFHCKSYYEDRCWTDIKWNSLAKKMIKHGFNIVEVGLKPVVRLGTNKGYYDCTKLDIQDTSEIIRNSEKFIGIDSGFAHIANCFDIPGVLIFGKFGKFLKRMTYTGPYASGRATILYPDNGGPASDVTVEQVLDALNIK